MERNEIKFWNLRSKKILLVEDVELNQYLAKHILESRGLQVAIANNGFEALALINQASFDCVLMDIQMPEMDGIQTTKQIRLLDDPAKSTVPIIALTANVLSEDIEKYRVAGMNDYLAKPFDESGLLTVISRNQAREDGASGSVNSQTNGHHIMAAKQKLYDLSIVQSVSGGDKAFVRKMILLFIETVPQNVKELGIALKEENWEQLGKMAHKLKSTVDSMGIKSIHADIRTVETNSKQKKDLAEIPALIRKIEGVIEQCLGQLQAEIE